MKSFESMSLKEIFLAGKDKGVVVPVHLRGTNAANDPRMLEEARQYLVAQLNELYVKQMIKRIANLLLAILVVSMAILLILGVQYYEKSHPKKVEQLPAYNSFTSKIIS